MNECRCRFVDENGETKGHDAGCPSARLWWRCPNCGVERADHEGPNCGSDATPSPEQPEHEEARRLTDEERAFLSGNRSWLAGLDVLARYEAYEALLSKAEQGLQRITTMPTTELNPDGEEQAAQSMQLVAQETLDQLKEVE